MSKKTKKSRAIHAELRKESKTFDGWLKYEVTIMNHDGTTEKVPAYGKDLQDALSRVVHDYRVVRILPKIRKVPVFTWVLVWFSFVTIGVIALTNNQHIFGDLIGLVFIGTIGIITSLSIGIGNYFKLKSVPK